ncbi:DUF3052 family protein [Halalkalibacter akibai]|uniref:DUF3052 domain-containing protein n=1 Tax=Halalkalibacter akibai (strain ATCC 43226 / DSM 21942 / CIP 109018 / JCM 9157 / 1139) TaxID=1236973 RepID=W4QY68_HALA3|nr:DUF3052 family protein [Halalkalibacter akibai]GAE37026.1 hypothetical protein JCM9157_4268 [Halalkalibacter akibai JCM 9157]
MELHPTIKKLQWKPDYNPVLIIGAPKEYDEVMNQFGENADTEMAKQSYGFIHIFATSNDELKEKATEAVSLLKDNGLFWLSYPKKASKRYKGSDCSRETVAQLLGEQGFEPVRQVAIDEDWSALRFRHVQHIKTMKRTFAATEEGKARTSKED